MKKQREAARRRRLEAIVAGARPDDVPIPVSEGGRQQFGRAAKGTREQSTDSAYDASGIAPADVLAEGPGARRVTADEDATAGLDAADAALSIAQRFLGSSFGDHFLDSAEGVSRPRPFSLHDGQQRPAAGAHRAIAGLRLSGIAAGAAAAMLPADESDSDEIGRAVAMAVAHGAAPDIYGAGAGAGGTPPVDDDTYGVDVSDTFDSGLAAAPRDAFEAPEELAPRRLPNNVRKKARHRVVAHAVTASEVDPRLAMICEPARVANVHEDAAPLCHE